LSYFLDNTYVHTAAVAPITAIETQFFQQLQTSDSGADVREMDILKKLAYITSSEQISLAFDLSLRFEIDNFLADQPRARKDQLNALIGHVPINVEVAIPLASGLQSTLESNSPAAGYTFEFVPFADLIQLFRAARNSTDSSFLNSTYFPTAAVAPVTAIETQFFGQLQASDSGADLQEVDDILTRLAYVGSHTQISLAYGVSLRSAIDNFFADKPALNTELNALIGQVPVDAQVEIPLASELQSTLATGFEVVPFSSLIQLVRVTEGITTDPSLTEQELAKLQGEINSPGDGFASQFVALERGWLLVELIPDSTQSLLGSAILGPQVLDSSGATVQALVPGRPYTLYANLGNETGEYGLQGTLYFETGIVTPSVAPELSGRSPGLTVVSRSTPLFLTLFLGNPSLDSMLRLAPGQLGTPADLALASDSSGLFSSPSNQALSRPVGPLLSPGGDELTRDSPYAGENRPLVLVPPNQPASVSAFVSGVDEALQRLSPARPPADQEDSPEDTQGEESPDRLSVVTPVPRENPNAPAIVQSLAGIGLVNNPAGFPTPVQPPGQATGETSSTEARAETADSVTNKPLESLLAQRPRAAVVDTLFVLGLWQTLEASAEDWPTSSESNRPQRRPRQDLDE
jgi:hypothetical protein